MSVNHAPEVDVERERVRLFVEVSDSFRLQPEVSADADSDNAAAKKIRAMELGVSVGLLKDRSHRL